MIRVLVLVAAASIASPSSFAGDGAVEAHPLVAKVLEYRAARERGDDEAGARFYAEVSRIWFDERKGPGRVRESGGGGPWAEWDRFFNARSTAEAFEVRDRRVSFLATETNDYYRLLDRPAGRLRITYTFDDEDRVTETLVVGLDRDDPDRGRQAEFDAWLEAHHADELDRLRPGGRIDPTPANARRFKELLLEWRSEAGLSLPPG